MGRSRTFNQPRYYGICHIIEFPEKPRCDYCGKPMKIDSHREKVNFSETVQTDVNI